MCGIAGILQPNPQQYTLTDLQGMTNALAHRGPDGADYWQSSDATVLLGHRRLKILDLSNQAKQPLTYLSRYTIVHNGEIYNYLELKETLSQKGYRFQTTGDTEVIAAAYDHWGAQFLAQLDGMFAFAIWDNKEHSLFAARDRFGEKPFYYSLQNHTLLFASEIKAFWPLNLPKQMDPSLTFHYLTLGYVDDPFQPDRTFFTHIHKLPAAHYLKYSAIYRTAAIERYWDLYLPKTPSIRSETEAENTFRQLLETSVSRRMRSDVPIGCSLSGGLDSSTLAQLIHEQTNTRLHTFTAIVPHFDRNEEDSARAIANHIHANAHFIDLNDTDWFALGMECLKHQDEPVGSSSVFAQYAVYQAIAQAGIKVVIDGQGADETLAGYERYYPWYWQELYRNRSWRSSGEQAYTRALGVEVPFSWKNKLAAFFPNTASRQRHREYQQQAKRNTELNEGFRQEQIKQFHHTMPEHTGLNGALYFNTCTHGLEELLRYADRNAMRFGVEVRLPFLSHELVEFIFSLPPHFKIREGWRKWILRRCMDKHLPPSICWNPNKIGYETPQVRWMQQPDFQEAIHESRKKLIGEKILSSSVTNRPIQPHPAHAPDPKDWRYFSLAQVLTD
ncbi:MAG: asparagine synthase (glutamine-hydrolyzing) [Bacteroidetes bacterium]|nr:asparagine synthase (glutamine-hydrolyzing) [Bacteroidota bacterium]